MMKKSNFFRTCILVMVLLVSMLAGYACEPTTPPDDGCEGGDTSYDTYSEGSYSTDYELRTGTSRTLGLFYPEGDGPFPVFLWGCGAGSDPSDYLPRMNHIASWGFIVVAEVSTGDGTELLSGLRWLNNQNDNPSSPVYQKADFDKIAAGGHSMGSITTYAIADDPRFTTTIHVAGGSFDGQAGRDLVHPAAFICGEDDSMATSNTEVDYRRADVPAYFTIMDGVGHMDATAEGLPAITAWLLWHLQGETERSAEFLESDGVFHNGIFDSQVKNW